MSTDLSSGTAVSCIGCAAPLCISTIVCIDSKMLKLCGDLFKQLPYCAVLGGHTFVVHGCIPTGSVLSTAADNKAVSTPAEAITLEELDHLPREWASLALDPEDRAERLIEEV